MNDIQEQISNIPAYGSKVAERVEETRTDLKEKASQTWNDTVNLVKRHPVAAISIAAGAGLALGSMIVALSRTQTDSRMDRLNKLAGNGADAWSRVADGLAEAVSDLKCAVSEAVSKFK